VAQTIEVTLPDIGDFHDVEVIEILVNPGDRVEAEDPLITLESDKASMEIPSPQAGKVAELKVAMGDRINQGDLIALLVPAEAGESDAAELLEDAPGAVAEAEPAPPVPDPAEVEAPATAAGPTEIRDIPLPDIGDFHDVEVIEVLVAVGDSVSAEQSLLTLESDKATMEIPSPVAGTVQAVNVGIGDRINRGDVIAQIVVPGDTPAAATPGGDGTPEPVATSPEQPSAGAEQPRLPGG